MRMKLEIAVILLGYLLCTATGTEEHEHEHGDDHEGHDDDDNHDEHGMISVTTIINPPFVMETGDGHFEGLAIDLLEELAHRVHFNYKIHLVEDGKWGSKDPSGDWNGMIGELLDGDADLAAAPIGMTDSRDNSGIYFVKPFMDEDFTILVDENVKISSIEDLLTSNLTFGCIEGGRARQQISESGLSPFIQWDFRIKNTPGAMVQTIEEGVKRARAGNYAFILDKATANYYVTQPPCNLKTVGDFLEVRNGGFSFAACPDHELLAMEMKDAMMDMEEDDDIAEILDKWMPETCESTGTGVIFHSHFASLGLAMLVGYVLRQ